MRIRAKHNPYIFIYTDTLHSLYVQSSSLHLRSLVTKTRLMSNLLSTFTALINNYYLRNLWVFFSMFALILTKTLPKSVFFFRFLPHLVFSVRDISGGLKNPCLLSFLRSIFCKWTVITVTPQTLKIAVRKIQD